MAKIFSKNIKIPPTLFPTNNKKENSLHDFPLKKYKNDPKKFTQNLKSLQILHKMNF
jgi:hypothetical protein